MTESEIIKGCIRGNINQQREFHELFYNKVYSICLRYSKSREEAKDLVNQAFLGIFESFKHYSEREPIDNWIKNLVIKKVIDFSLHKKQNLIVSTVDAHNSTEIIKKGEVISDDKLVNLINKETVLKAIQELTPAYRRIYNLSVIDGYTHEEIAQILNTSEETSKVTLQKAKYNLRKNLIALLKPVHGK